MSESHQERLKSRIESDLAAFADPGGVRTSSGRRRFSAEWTMRGKPREAKFTVSPDHGVTVHADNKTQPYAVFLAGTGMADLRHVAQMIGHTGRGKIFIPTRARRTDTKSLDPRPATDLLTSLLENSEAETTQVIMVTGEAGAGKTHVLRESVLRQADRYLHGRTNKLLLYVNAQGRALARLNEALATELQDLKVDLTYHCIATLARVGLLVPVIDGFDELLGTSGYDDAFNSLATFLEQLEGYGHLIASARSIYYEEEFLSRAGRISATGGQAWSHVPVEIIPWKDDDRNGFLHELAVRESLPEEERTALCERVREVFADRDELASKPLFFAKTVDLLREDPEFHGSDDLLDTLTRRFLEREQHEKLLDRQQQPLLSRAHLERLMEELAEEMWNQETRELDRGSVREIAEYVLDGVDMSESARQIVIERMPALAFLAPGERHGNILFEHEVFFFHFLVRTIVNQYARGADMHIMLSRSALPEFVAERLAFELRQRGRLSTLGALQEILGRLSEAGRARWRRTDQIQENAGLITMALLREFANHSAHSEIADCTISNVVFPGSNLRGVTLRNCMLDNVSIRRTNLHATKFIECRARAVLLLEPRVKVGSTRLELIGLQVPAQVLGIQDLGDEGSTTIYTPKGILRVMHECGAPVETGGEQNARDVPEEWMELLERLMRAYEKANPVCDGDRNLQRLFSAPRWPELCDLLIRHDIVRLDPRPASGARKKFLRRRFPPDEIMSAANKASNADPRIVRFWDDLERAAAA